MAAKVIILLMIIAVYFGSSTDASEKIHLKLSAEECYETVRLATAGDQLNMVKLLVDQGCSVYRPLGSKSKAPTPLHIAIVNRNLQMAKVLVAYGADVNAVANIAKELMADKDKRVPMCKYLLKDGGIDVSANSTLFEY